MWLKLGHVPRGIPRGRDPRSPPSEPAECQPMVVEPGGPNASPPATSVQVASATVWHTATQGEWV